MNPKDIMIAIDPKGARIDELEKNLEKLNWEATQLRQDLHDAQRHELERKWMREHGIMIETTEGMKYLKDEDYDKFFKRLKIKGKFDPFNSAPVRAEGQAIDYDISNTFDYELMDEEEE